MLHFWRKEDLTVEYNSTNDYMFVCTKTHVLGVLKPNTTVWLRSSKIFPRSVEHQLQHFVEENISYGAISHHELAVLYKMFGNDNLRV